MPTGITQILSRKLIHPDNEALFEGALLLLLLLSSLEKGENPVIAACTRQWPLKFNLRLTRAMEAVRDRNEYAGNINMEDDPSEVHKTKRIMNECIN